VRASARRRVLSQKELLSTEIKLSYALGTTTLIRS
jgi:hypothetical protein